VRELKNAIQRALLLGRGDSIEPEALDLPTPVRTPNGDEEIDRDAIEQALARSRGVLSQAAAELGLSRQALYRRMDKLGIAR
jgi:DNA-binding NtrC family response regulator